MPPKLSIIMPAYNEANTIGDMLAKVRAAPLRQPWELIVVDDWSTDGTRQAVEKLMGEGSETTRVVSHAVNRGKGPASGRASPMPRGR